MIYLYKEKPIHFSVLSKVDMDINQKVLNWRLTQTPSQSIMVPDDWFNTVWKYHSRHGHQSKGSELQINTDNIIVHHGQQKKSTEYT